MNARGPDSGSRLERAIEVWLAHVEAGGADDAALLAAHPDLRELLEPMLASRESHETAGRVVGDFRLRGELGRGGMGIVYEAWQQSLGRRVALKVLAPALVADGAAIARFHREAAAAGRLRHPGIVEVHGVGHDGDTHWFAMELIEGEPLHRCRDRFRAPPAAVALVAQVLDALQHAHAAGLVHRDVKPANILVRGDGHVVLTDFGLARDVSSPTMTVEGGFLGTLDYAAPEQLQAQPVDARADVWSTGVVLAELLTGRHPFAGDNATATLRAVLTAEPTMATTGSTIDRDLTAITARALEKDPARRYPSAVAFLADLRAWQQGAAVAARMPTTTERLRRWARREPWRALAAALLVVGVPLLAVVSGYLWANAPRIDAAARAERAEQREQALAAAWIALNDERHEEGLRALGPWTDDDDDLEVRFAQACLLSWLKPGTATDPLAPFAGTRVHELVSLLLRGVADLPFRFEDVDSDSMLECAALGHLAFDQVRVHRRSASFYRHAAKWFGRAVALSPQPRSWLLLQRTIAAARADDAGGFADGLAAYEHFFPGTRGLQLLYAFGAAHVPVERGLAVLGDPALDADPRVLIARGQLLSRARRVEEAIAAFERGLSGMPENARAWTQLARLRRTMNDAEGALAAITRATAADPGFGEAVGVEGALLAQLGRLPEARTALERATSLDPADWKTWQNLGLVLHDTGEDERALAAFEKAAAAAIREPAPYACMARTLRRLDRVEEAFVAEVKASTFASDTDHSAPFTLAARALEVGLWSIARGSAERATRIAPNLDATWWRLAEVHLDGQPRDPAAAAAAVAKALAIDAPVSPRERSIQGRTAAANGQVAAAIELLEAALREADKIPPLAREKARAELARLRQRP